jgi:hypothetical protein
MDCHLQTPKPRRLVATCWTVMEGNAAVGVGNEATFARGQGHTIDTGGDMVAFVAQTVCTDLSPRKVYTLDIPT